MTQKKTVHMACLTAADMREIAARDPVLLLPLGSFEDQGPCTPMGDYLLADKVAERIALKATGQGYETYVAPVLPFGGADYFGYMPGGIALSQTTLRAVLTDIFECLLTRGFKKIIVLNGHGGNSAMIHDVTRQIMKQTEVVIPNLYLWRAASELLPQLLGAQKAQLSAGHGANPLFSIAMHLCPDLVKSEALVRPEPDKEAWGLKVADFGQVSLNGVSVSLPFEGDVTATQGIGRGDPALCDAETGLKLTDRLVETGVLLVRHMTKKNS